MVFKYYSDYKIKNIIKYYFFNYRILNRHEKKKKKKRILGSCDHCAYCTNHNCE